MIWFPFASLPFSHVAVAVGCTLIVGVVRDATVLVIADVAADVTASKWRFSVPDSADVTSRPLLACCQLEVLTARLPVENSESIRCLKMENRLGRNGMSHFQRHIRSCSSTDALPVLWSLDKVVAKMKMKTP